MSVEGYDNIAFTSSDESDNEYERQSIASDYHFIPEVEVSKSWDKFRQTEDEAKSASEQNTTLIEKGAILLKIVTCVIVFCVVLGGAVVSKASLVYIVAQTASLSQTDEGMIFCGSNNETSYYSKYHDETRVAWLWCLFFIFMVPECLTFLRSVRMMINKYQGKPTWIAFAVVFLFETLHVLGVALLFFVALPEVDSIKALMITNGVAVIPSFLLIFQSDYTFGKNWNKYIFLALSITAFVIQIGGLIIWPISADDMVNTWTLPVGILLVSFGWWESFVSQNAGALGKVGQYLYAIRRDMFEKNQRYFMYFFISIWKIIWFLSLFLIFTASFDIVPDVPYLFNNFKASFSTSRYTVYQNSSETDGTTNSVQDTNITFETNLPKNVLLTQLACAWATYIFAKFACKTNIQRVAFALPLNLVMPVVVSGLIGMCTLREDNPCKYTEAIPKYTFFQCPAGSSLVDEFGWYWFLLILSQFWITFFVWYPKSQRLASTEQMFGTPYYSGLLIDQSILFNRRSDSGRLRFRLDVKGTKKPWEKEEVKDSDNEEVKVKKKRLDLTINKDNKDGKTSKHEVSRVYGCATMWHESSEEIEEMLKSIFRIDEDYSARFLAKSILQVDDPDFYEWETHIFFDDCMEPDDTGKEFQVNQFVRLLISQVDIQGKKWYGSRNMKVPYPVKIPTPYGGRLIWTLPGRTKIVCHLKDKNKIRHKKRWSQCMYMYYFLGHKLTDNDKLTEAEKEMRAQNTYLLALDGDVDFQPDAIIKLIDLMKRNPSVGASCGRIHPTGSGYMQWYQKFEYAIGHWLQKSTEHVMGCVLCSPGCFSLFRGRAVMDDNIMRTYTTVATEPRHYVQYDQGEDRWLCTLLLQQGWRVEYSAASDSFTACPEGFKEFYNQRRRWMPSTIANIMDLLSDWKRVVRNNDDISPFYIAYQIMMMVGTVLGPGSIFLMLIGACAIAFHISNANALIMNLVPMTVFIIVCLTCKPDIQIMFAQLLSVLYALVMMAVLVGLIIEMSEDGWLAPTTLSFMFVTFTFCLCAVLHPQEFWCLPNGLIYYITIPSMYLFLVIYSVFNLNVVSWGTREVPKKLTAEEMEAQKAAAEEEAKKPPKKKKGIMGWFQRDRWLEFSMRNMFSEKGGVKGYMDKMDQRLEAIEMALKHEGYEVPVKPEELEEEKKEKKSALIKRTPTVRIVLPEEPKIERNDLRNPYWIEDEALGDGPRKNLPRKEVQFWYEMIEKYLKPLEKDKEKEKQVSAGLKELRNQMVFSFLMINSIWIVTVFLMQQNKDKIYIEWPWGPKGPNLTYFDNNLVKTVFLEYEYLQLEPIGLIFVLFFAVVLFVQLIGMLLHRIMTLGHVVSTTKIRRGKKRYICCGDSGEFDANKMLQKKGVGIIKELQAAYKPDESNDGVTMQDAIEQQLDALTTGDPELIGRVSNVSLHDTNPNLVRKETLHALKRRHTTYQKRKATMKKRNGSQRAPPPATIKEENEHDLTDAAEQYEVVPEQHLPPARTRYDSSDQEQHQPVSRTATYLDPDGLEEREI